MLFSVNVFAQKEHFGMIQGPHYNTDNIARGFLEHYGDSADFGDSGNFYQIRVYSSCSKEGAPFGGCTIDFYKGRFWKIRYSDIKNDPNYFAERLEWKYMDYSISETNFEYRYDSVYFEFDGNQLRYIDENVSRSCLATDKAKYFKPTYPRGRLVF